MSKNTTAKTKAPAHFDITVGEILAEDYLKPMGITPYRLAKDIGVSAIRISEIIRGKREITLDTALRLSRYFGNSAEQWLGMQTTCQLRAAEALRGQIEREVKPLELEAA